MQEIFKSPSLLSCMFIACLWRIKHDNATAFTLFVYISKWNALHSNKIAMQIAKYLREWKREQDFFSAPNSTDPGKHLWQHPYKTSRLWKDPEKHPQKVMKDCVKDRIDTILVSTAFLK